MEFASKFGYDYGHQGSDSEEDDTTTRRKSKSPNGKKERTRRTQLRQADSNVIAVKFDQLLMPNEMFAGEAIKCAGCGAIMTANSKKLLIETTKVWPCEFCTHANDLLGSLGSLDEIPNGDDVTFLLEPAPVKQTSETKGGEPVTKSLDSNYLAYCVDISGSMDTQIEIKNHNEPNTASNMTRLEGVKTACVENIKMLKEQEPNKRVGLVTFSDSVKFYGDASKIKDNKPLVEVGGGHSRLSQFQRAFTSRSSQNESNSQDLLDNQEKLLALAKNQSGDLKPIKDSYPLLELRLRGLKTEGSTALGPALVFSVGFCSKQAGSQIVLCTDGAANIGMGSMNSGFATGEDSSEKFYEDLADYARQQNVTVNVISMEGTDCKLALLGKVADKTNGTINIVNPLNLSKEFKSILENRVVATSVRARLIVNNKYLYIRDEELEVAEAKRIENPEAVDEATIDAIKKSIVERDIGNANIDTEITFEYGMRRLGNGETRDSLGSMPFQLQVTYETPEGAKAVRVYTRLQEFTRDRAQAQGNVVSQDVIWSNAAQKMSSYALSSNVYTSKLKQAQVANYRTRNKLDAPVELVESENVILATNATRATDFGDVEAKSLFAGKKMNRNKFSKS